MLFRALHLLPPEKAHRLALAALRHGLLKRRAAASWPRLETTLAGLTLPNPLGLAAGFDKDGEAVAGLAGLGFGWVEIGTVTPRPQAGNPSPRLLRLPEAQALINRMGFNNQGVEALRRQLERRTPDWGVVGVNIGANRDSTSPRADYVLCLDVLYEHADYFTINVSSPNTPGLRQLQEKHRLSDLLGALLELRSRKKGPQKPLFLKISPDLRPKEEADITTIALELAIDGLVVSNTTVARPEEICGRARHEAGGLSGQPLFEPATEQLRRIHEFAEGRLTLIGAGGIQDGASALAKIRAGASALQLYTALIYHGPRLVVRILDELDQLLADAGLSHLGAAIGTGPPAVPVSP